MTDYRHEMTTRVCEMLTSHTSGLWILGICGQGGVGKTFLLNQMQQQLPDDYMRLRADASAPESRADFLGVISQLSPLIIPESNTDADCFPCMRKLQDKYEELQRTLQADLDKHLSAPGTGPENVPAKELLLALCKCGALFHKNPNSAYGAVELLANDNDVQQTVQFLWEQKKHLPTFNKASPLNPLAWIGKKYKRRLRCDLQNLVAEALVADLTELLTHHRNNNPGKETPGKMKKAKRLLIELDDYEQIGPMLDEFLVSSLTRRLAQVGFPTMLVIVSRDDYRNSHPGWNQHCAKYMKQPDPIIPITPFDQDTTNSFLEERSIIEDRWKDVYAKSRGLPFIVDMLAAGIKQDSLESALFARQFYDRVTRWMSPTEKRWFNKVLLLDAVNLETLESSFAQVDERERVMTWFQNEASIRDPVASVWTVRPIVREVCLRYLKSVTGEATSNAATAGPV